MLSDEFSVSQGVRQGCPLSLILFYLFMNINDVLDNCDKYGVNTGNKKCCSGLFEDDIVLITLTETKMNWVNKNEMSFGINKCASMVIKPLNFVSYHGYEDPTFYLGIYSILKESSYIYIYRYSFQYRSVTQTYYCLYGV